MPSNIQVSKNVSNGMEWDFKQLFQNSPVAGYTCDANGKLTSFNKAATEVWGRTPILGKEYWRLLEKVLS